MLMGTALKMLREFLDKKTATSLLALLLVLGLIPVGLFLIKQAQIFQPKAAGELIQLGEGGCIRVNKDKQKAVDCSLVPLKITNPFFNINAVNPSVGGQSPSPTSAAGRRTVRVSGNSDTAIQAALDAVKDTGGAVYLPAGTYQISKKIRLYSNTTLFGDGPGATILQENQAVVTKGEPMIGNDSNRGQQNVIIRDMTLKGPGGESGKDRCCEGLRLANLDGGFVINVEVRDFTWNGIYIRYINGLGSKNIRVSGCRAINNKGAGIAVGQGENIIIDNCEASSNNFSTDPGKQDASINLEIGVDGGITSSKVLNNLVRNNENAGISLKADQGFVVSNNAVCFNTSEGNGDVGIADAGGDGNIYIANKIRNNQDRNDSKIVICDQSEINKGVCDNLSKNITEDESPGATNQACIIPSQFNIPAAPSKPVALNIGFVKDVLAQEVAEDKKADKKDNKEEKNKDQDKAAKSKEGKKCKEDKDCKDSKLACVDKKCVLKPEVVQDSIVVALPTTDNAESVTQTFADNQSAVLSGKLLYRLAQSQAGLEQAPWKEFAFLPAQTNLASKGVAQTLSELVSTLLDKINPFVYAVDSDDVFLNREASSPPPSSPGSSGTPTFNIGPQFINTSFQLSSEQIGAKQIWIQLLHPDGTTRVDNVNFNLVEKPPQILGLSCNLDISKENLKITIEGVRFGSGVGTVEAVSPQAKPEVLGWNNKQIIAFLKKPNIPINEGQRFKFKVTRLDGFESGVATCAVDKSLVSLGARIFCREAGNFDASDVIVNLLYNPSDPANPDKLNKVEEKVTINANGEIGNLKTKLQVGKNYAISIKAPSSLRRATTFTAQEGTTQISQLDGSPFILPIGDIAPPVSPDGRINTLDRAELIRQWRILGKESTKQTGDFNRDTRVNSVDWACMNYDFGKEDDPIPTFLPQSASGSIQIPGGEETIVIPSSASPAPTGSRGPEPSPSKDTSNSAKIDIGGKLFLDTNRNRIADIGESFISQGLAVVRLLQVPEDHVVGTTLTPEELGDSRILAQVTNNLPGANYDISVFVDKDSGTKFSLLATANSGQLEGTIDFALGPPLTNSSLVINLPVSSPTQ